MREVVCLFLALLVVLVVLPGTVHASDGLDHAEIGESAEDYPESDVEDLFPGQPPIDEDAEEAELLLEQERWDQLMLLLGEIALGLSVPELPDPEPEPIPAIHELMNLSGTDSLIQPMSIGTNAAYPYTGGSFMALTTNYGSGVMTLPEPFKINTFGFIKNTNRIINMTNSTINGYWIMGGNTYNARITRYGEFEYQYTTSGTSQWRTLSVSQVSDTNVQFLDETGERGIQRPYITLTDKLLFLFIAVELLVHGIQLVRGRR